MAALTIFSTGVFRPFGSNQPTGKMRVKKQTHLAGLWRREDFLGGGKSEGGGTPFISGGPRIFLRGNGAGMVARVFF
jgi:hypothetical protein